MINDKRWQDANEAEKRSWQAVLSNEQETRNTDLFHRHAPVMFLDVDTIENKRIIDIGGGPISLMLHYPSITGTVVDPIDFDQKWIENYRIHNIEYVQQKAEDFLENFSGKKYDEIWMYNCLQHVQDPLLILYNLHKVASVLRISEPCNTPIDLWHPHTFTPEWYRYILGTLGYGKWNNIMYDYPYVGGVWKLI